MSRQDPLSGPLIEGELEVVDEDFYDSPILRVSIFKTPAFENEPVVAISLFDHIACTDRDDIRTVNFTEEDLEKYLAALRKHKEPTSADTLKSPHFCEHANEAPQQCPCSSDCYCRQKGNTCS